ncbi:MAG: type II toxin-antitoxin system Phd/YefM family antitoxin [Verrucomicrobiaceae bacterium]|nr:MAG: type II toxin-antitoxin system Phd/YefM family antitoxin [Verrucomicrobiaceae bacterium]
MSVVTISEAKAHFSKLIQRALAGEDIIIAKHGQPLVRLQAVHPNPPARVFGGLKHMVLAMGNSFNNELEDFANHAPPLDPA